MALMHLKMHLFFLHFICGRRCQLLNQFYNVREEIDDFSMKNNKECRGLIPRQGTKLGTEVIFKRVGQETR